MSSARNAGPASALLAGITLAGALLRFATLDVQSYWLDEVATVNTLKHGFGEMFSAISAGESTPPVYYVFAWLWSKLFGTGEVGLRSLSALLGTATIRSSTSSGARSPGERDSSPRRCARSTRC